MTGLALQIDDKWAVLDEDVSVSIEDNSPVWGDGNSFSLPFSLNVEANRHILGNSDQITGQSVYDVLDGRRAVLYTLGIPVYYGKIKMDDEVEIAEGYVDVTLVSGNLTFDEMIDGMNCQDVELMDRVVIGDAIYKSTLTWTVSDLAGGMPYMSGTADFKMNSVELIKMNKTNVSIPYSSGTPYCNIRICYPRREKDENGNYKELREYVVLEHDRKGSAPCFYVMYFLDCLFYKLGIIVGKNTLATMEDMTRLAFVNTRCAFDVDPDVVGYDKVGTFAYNDPRVNEYATNFDAGGLLENLNLTYNGFSGTITLAHNQAIANSKNFPDTDVSSVIDSLKNAFGIVFIYNNTYNTLSVEYVKDILKNNEVKELHAEVHEQSKVESKITGFKLTYTGDENDTNYNYTDYTKISDGRTYKEIKDNVNAYDKTCYVDKNTGNMYRYKVDSEAEKEEEWFPSTYEVGAFNAYEYGDCSQDDFVETREISFSPVIMNDVFKIEESSNSDTESDEPEADLERQIFALFADVEMNEVGTMKVSHNRKYYEEYLRGLRFWYSYDTDQNYDRSDNEESPIQEYDWGLTLGIMRGPGNESDVIEYDQNFDGEGNIKYDTVVADYSFTSDIMDNYGNLFDYNGLEEGGVGLDGRFSLRIKAERKVTDEYKKRYKEEELRLFEEWSWSMTDEEREQYILDMNQRIDQVYAMEFFPILDPNAQRRGLFDKFYTEYAYFVVNRKIVKMVCRMEMADVLNIDWTKRYKIGDYTGFINKYSYTVDSTGMSDVTLEMYYI